MNDDIDNDEGTDLAQSVPNPTNLPTGEPGSVGLERLDDQARRLEDEARQRRAVNDKRVFAVGPDGRRTYLDGPAPETEAEPSERPAADAPLPPLKEATFELSVPDNLTSSQKTVAAEYASDLASIASEVGIPAETMQELYVAGLDIAVGLTTDGGRSNAEEPNLANPEECYGVLVARYGKDEADKLIKLSNAAVAKLPRRVRDWLDAESPMGERRGNAPSVVAALAFYQEGLYGLPRDEAMRRLDALKKNPEYLKGSKSVVDRAAVLARRAFPEEGRGPKPRAAAPAAPTRDQQLKAELQSLRLDPAYFDKSRPNHKAVVARVQAIYTQMHPEK